MSIPSPRKSWPHVSSKAQVVEEEEAVTIWRDLDASAQEKSMRPFVGTEMGVSMEEEEEGEVGGDVDEVVVGVVVTVGVGVGGVHWAEVLDKCKGA